MILALKVVAIFVGAIVVILVLAFSGALFAIWPTTWPDQTLGVTPNALNRLRALRLESKFNPDSATHYPGATNEVVRAAAQTGVDTLIDALIAGLPSQNRKSFVLSSFKVTLTRFGEFDSEERDRLNWYLSEIMEILSIESSNELLNVWRYGLPLGWLSRGA